MITHLACGVLPHPWAFETQPLVGRRRGEPRSTPPRPIVLVIALLLAVLAFAAQNPTIVTTVPLVVVPATVTDRKGRFLDGLSTSDFQVLDNGTLERLESETEYQPISLVVAIQTNVTAAAALAKVRKIGPTFEPLVTGERGELEILAYGDGVRTVQPFTSDYDASTGAIAALRSEGDRAPLVDAVAEAIANLEGRPGNRRRIIITIGESKDRGSKAKLQDVLTRAQRSNVLIYSLTYSPYRTAFIAKPRDLPQSGDSGVNLLGILQEVGRLGQENTAEAFAHYTGGRVISFLKQRGLEQAVSRVGEELHAQYILTFTPPRSTAGVYHTIEVKLPGRPDAVVRARPGYWLGE